MYKRLLIITIVAVFFLIFVGSTVRSTGAGMGCPDWPKCFGCVTPPSSEADLPANYKEMYTEIRLKKNLRLEKRFMFFGMEDVMHNRQSGHSTYKDVEYDFTKAWIEYLNRVVGVIVGFLVLGCFLFSFKYVKTDFNIVVLSFVALIILLVEAFLGSVVVSTNLFPELISVHMLLALVLVFLLMFIYMKLNPPLTINERLPKIVIRLSVLAIVVTLIQMFLGIEVREMVDYWHNHEGIYTGVIERLGTMFYVHRSFSILVLLVNVWLMFTVGRYGVNNRWSKLILPIIIAEIFTGVTLG